MTQFFASNKRQNIRTRSFHFCGKRAGRCTANSLPQDGISAAPVERAPPAVSDALLRSASDVARRYFRAGQRSNWRHLRNTTPKPVAISPPCLRNVHHPVQERDDEEVREVLQHERWSASRFPKLTARKRLLDPDSVGAPETSPSRIRSGPSAASCPQRAQCLSLA